MRVELVSTGWQSLRGNPICVLFRQRRRVPLNENADALSIETSL
jgi:hypothetical protein